MIAQFAYLTGRDERLAASLSKLASQAWPEARRTSLPCGGVAFLAGTATGPVPPLNSQRSHAYLTIGPAGVVRCGTGLTGSEPVYWSVIPTGTIVSTSLTLLARLVRPRPSLSQSLSFLRGAYFLGNDSFFEDIYRLQPGQFLEFDGDTHSLREGSDLWVGSIREPSSSDFEAAWSALVAALALRPEDTGRRAIMLSAGWDSRTLLAAAQGGDSPPMLAYSHGDPTARELRLARQLAELAGLEHVTAPLSLDSFRPAFLRSCIERVETALFPHWVASADILASMGVTSVVSGVYGEVLGGHYGGTMVASSHAKPLALLRALRRVESVGVSEEDLPLLVAWFGADAGRKPWYLKEEAWDASVYPAATLDAVAADLTRLYARGVRTRDQLVEAYIAEHRGSQYINAQALSQRHGCSPVLPFTDPTLLSIATSLPMWAKAHNQVNRRFLGRSAPSLARLPGSATLVAFSAPLLVQEASRIVRKLWEGLHWRAHHLFPRQVGAPTLSWVTLETLRSAAVLDELVEELRGDWWDKGRMHDALAARRAHRSKESMHPITDQLLKIYTMDAITGLSP